MTLQGATNRHGAKPQAKLTPRERAQAWYDHMKGVLAQDPANMGKTIIMLNNGRTYRFHIPEPRIPTVADVTPAVTKTEKAVQAPKRRTTRTKESAS